MFKQTALSLLILLTVGSLGRSPAQQPSAGKSVEEAGKGKWVSVSDGLLGEIGKSGRKPVWPGGTAGVSVDRATGEIRVVVPGEGLWKSGDHGATFSCMDHESNGGRCETGFALNADPAGKRLACFLLDGPSMLTPDNGKTWNALLQHGRGWDYGVVDWSTVSPQTLLAVHHESGAELHLSTDAGKSWKLLGKDFTAVGLFDAHTFVASRGDGVLRSTDGGVTWTRVSDRTPTGRTLCVLQGVGYWVSREGLLVSKDKGLTWSQQGSPLEAAWGPFFGRDARQIVVVGRKDRETGFWRTDDAGTTWKRVAPFPDFGKDSTPDWTPSKQWAAGWFFNFGWDPVGNLFYASRMGHPTFKYQPD